MFRCASFNMDHRNLCIHFIIRQIVEFSPLVFIEYPQSIHSPFLLHVVQHIANLLGKTSTDVSLAGIYHTPILGIHPTQGGPPQLCEQRILYSLFHRYRYRYRHHPSGPLFRWLVELFLGPFSTAFQRIQQVEIPVLIFNVLAIKRHIRQREKKTMNRQSDFPSKWEFASNSFIPSYNCRHASRSTSMSQIPWKSSQYVATCPTHTVIPCCHKILCAECISP